MQMISIILVAIIIGALVGLIWGEGAPKKSIQHAVYTASVVVAILAGTFACLCLASLSGWF